MRICSKCGNEISETAKFCPYCRATQETQSEEPLKEQASYYCTICGRKWKPKERYCPVCGNNNWEEKQKYAKLEGKRGADRNGLERTKVKRSADCQENVKKAPENQKKNTFQDGSMTGETGTLLKLFGIIIGIFYVTRGLFHLTYLGRYDSFDKFWGAGMAAAYLWSCVVLFVIAGRCKKEQGITMLYALWGGEGVKIILYIFQAQRITRYIRYVTGTSVSYLPIVGVILVAAAGYYLMKKEGLLYKKDGWATKDYITAIPSDLHMLVFPNDDDSGNGMDTGKKGLAEFFQSLGGENTNELRTENDKILFVVGDSIFLFLSSLYTVNLLYSLFSSFSFLKLFTNILSILMSIAMWRIYFNSRKGSLDAAGFSIASGITWIQTAAHIAGGIVLLVASIVAGPLVFLAILIIFILDICYWISISKILSAMKANAKKGWKAVTAGIYPVFILGCYTASKCISFIWACMKQSAADSINGSLNQYGNTASSFVGDLFAGYGLGFNNGYSISSSGIRSILNPITGWIQDKLGFSENPVIMLIGIAIPVLEILLLLKIRSCQSAETEEAYDER